MKASSAYQYALKKLNALEIHKKTILDNFATANAYELVSMANELKIAKAELKVVQEFYYEVATVEEITAVVQEHEIESEFSWSKKTKFNRNVLPEQKYCKHVDWVKDPKLQALMPNKKF